MSRPTSTEEALRSVNKALSLSPGYENAKKARNIVLDLLNNQKTAPGPAGTPLPKVPVATARKHPRIVVAAVIVIVVIGISHRGLLAMKSLQDNAGTTLPASPAAALATPANPATTQPPGSGPEGIPVGRGQFVFNDSLGNADRPITVYTYGRRHGTSPARVLFVMPGAGRDGLPPRETWIPYAERSSALLVVPEFSQQYYPGDMWYPLGNTYDDKNWVPKANWSFMAVEHLFDYVREKSGATQPTYFLDGHSAGAQFVHRMVTFLPDARYNRAVAANAGVYVMPDYSVPYPLGLKDSPLPKNGFRTCSPANSLLCPAGATRTRTTPASRTSPGPRRRAAPGSSGQRRILPPHRQKQQVWVFRWTGNIMWCRGSGTMRQEWPGRPQRCSSTAVEGPGQTRKWVKCRPF